MKRYDPVTGEVSETLFQYDGMPLGENEDWDGMTGVKIVFHPTGNYAYIIHAKSSIIMKCEYDWAKKVLLTQNSWAVGSNYGGHVDGVGTEAQLNRPYGGVFVKNDYYVSEALRISTISMSPIHGTAASERSLLNMPFRPLQAAAAPMLRAMSGWVTRMETSARSAFRHSAGHHLRATSGTFYIADRHYRRVRKITYLD